MNKLLLASLCLAMSSSAFSAELTPICQDYYAEIDRFVEKLASTKETKALANEIMENYPHAKNEHMSMPAAEQDRSCSREAAELREYQEMMAAEG
ncbi:MAG: DUF5339 family protein [Paenalcaligenes sp.]